jgi:Na+/H+ antiporter NhaD/arsenite permease-like protein
MHAAIIILVFLCTYVGMAAGRLPHLQIDRNGIALLGVIVLLASGTVTLDELGASIDVSTLVLLFALMIISAQFVSAGFFEVTVEWILRRTESPTMMLALTVGVGGALSALLANEVVVLTMAPLLITGAQARTLDPRPFLIALMGAANAGSAATLIGSPPNILIGQIGELSFHYYLLAGVVPALLALVSVFAVTWFLWRDRMEAPIPAGGIAEVPRHPHDRHQTVKGLAGMAVLLLLFATSLPREVGGLLIAAALLTNRRFTNRIMIAAVDWPLLLLFVCLFAVSGALADTGIPWTLISWLQAHQMMPDNLLILAPMTLIASNTIGNTPWAILLLQAWPNPPQGPLYALAVLSSLAANLTLVGSLASVIAVERAEALGVRLSFSDYARAGVPFTLISMAFAVCWLALTGWLPLLPGSGAAIAN